MTFRERLVTFFKQKPEKQKTNVKAIIFGSLVIIGAGGVFMVSRWYSTNREQTAHRAFNDCLQKYYAALSDGQNWPLVERMCQEGYSQFASSSFGPYFLVYKAEALIRQNRVKDALAEMDGMLSILPKSSPVFGMYTIKRQLMAFDVELDEPYMQELQQTGELEKFKANAVHALEQLASDKKNMHRDMALYYLGFYHWTHDAIDLAKKVWQELVALKGDGQTSSPWATLVQDKVA